jgi:type I restriction enzyme, S subunit
MLKWNLKIKSEIRGTQNLKSKHILLSDLVNLKNGKFISSKEFTSSGQFPVYGSNGIIGKVDKSLYQTPLIIIGRAGASGYVQKPTGSFWASDNTIVAEPKQNVDFDYLFYKLKSLNLKNHAIGSAQPLLTQNILNSIEIQYVEFSKQKQIGKILKKIDHQIQHLENINYILTQFTQLIFKSWFVNFDVVQKFEKTPKSSCKGNLDDLAYIKSGKRPEHVFEKSSSVHNIPLYGASGIMGFVKDSLYDNRIIVTGRVGTIGVVNYVNEKSFPSDNTLLIIPKDPNYFNYIFCFLSTFNFDLIKGGSTQPLITQTDLKNIPCIIPNERELEKFELTLKPIFNMLFNNKLVIKNLQVLFNLILPKLMSGTIKI